MMFVVAVAMATASCHWCCWCRSLYHDHDENCSSSPVDKRRRWSTTTALAPSNSVFYTDRGRDRTVPIQRPTVEFYAVSGPIWLCRQNRLQLSLGDTVRHTGGTDPQILVTSNFWDDLMEHRNRRSCHIFVLKILMVPGSLKGCL